MAKTKRKQDSDESVVIKDYSKKWHNCTCLCVKNIPGYPNRVGYDKVYVDINNKTRCVYCDCYAPDPRTAKEVIVEEVK